MQHFTVENFYPRAKDLREQFDRRFANPLHTHADRFVWDFWHVPGEYTTLRTPAFQYFSKNLYQNFHRHLVRWGRETLGCHDISPPWLSCYIEGCRQEAHQDLPHGPLAFVFSLTPWRNRKFSGGETFIKKPRTQIEPLFNRLTIFNPALVHGVRQVRGTMDPRDGRLVIHGWFVNPRPFWVGPLSIAQVSEGLDGAFSNLHLSKRAAVMHGLASYRIWIQPSGKVREIKTLVSTLSVPNFETHFADQLKKAVFPNSRARTILTLPVTFN